MPSPPIRLLARLLDELRSRPLFWGAVAVITTKLTVGTFVAIDSVLKANLLFGTLAAVLFFVAPAMALPGRIGLFALVAADFLLSLVLQSNVVYYRQFADLISFASLRYAGLAGEVHGAIGEILKPVDLLIWLDVAVLLALAVRAPPAARAQLPSLRPRRAALVMVGSLLLMASVLATTSRIRAKHMGHTGLTASVGLYGYHLVDAGMHMIRGVRKSRPPPAEQARVAEALRRRPDPQAGPLAGIARGKNVIVLQVESFQDFPVGKTFRGQRLTPRLDQLASESLTFSRFYAQTAQGNTSDAELLATCSMYPVQNGAVFYDHAANEYRCTPEVLGELGYRTVVMHANKADFWNRGAMYPAIGYQTFHSRDDYREGVVMGFGLNDEDFYEQSVEKLKVTPEPYYAMMISLTNHRPFGRAPMPDMLDVGELEGTELGKYLESVYYTDLTIGMLLDRLKEEGILDRSVLVVYGDHHGMPAYTMDRAAEMGLASASEPFAALEYERRVPLWIRLPGGERAQRIGASHAQVDIAPTILDLLGVARPPVMLGHSMISEAPAPVVFPNGAALHGDLIWVDREGGRGREGCFLRSSATEAPRGACNDLRKHAAEQLEISRSMIEFDLVSRVLAALASTTAGI